MNIPEIRNYFPYLLNKIIYFNHASTGPISKPVINIINSVLAERSQSKMDDYQSFLVTVDETKKLLSDYLKTDKGRIAFTDNTSNGLNMLAQSLNLNAGDKILLNDIEFPANVYPFLNLHKKGIRTEFVKSNDGIVTAEDLINAADKNTKVISVSYVQFLSGYRLDIKKLGQFCRNNNIILVVDSIQGSGALQLNVEDCNVDFLSNGTQKWLFGLQGMAFIYISESLQKALDPAFAGWLSVENAWDLLNYSLDFKSSASIFQTGTINTLGVYALNESLKMLESFGYDKIENNVTDNTLFLRNKLDSHGIKLFPSSLDEKYFSGIVSFRHPEADGLYQWLSDRKIIVSVREGIIRLSPHFYNTADEIEQVVDAIINY